MKKIGVLIRWFFVALLAVSGIAKLADMPGFYDIVKTYDLLPAATVPVAAHALALFELGLAAWLASEDAARKSARYAAAAVIALHAVYLGWLLVALARGLHIANCGCFGVYWRRPLNWFTPLEDLILLILAILLWRSCAPRKPTT
jgi:hypothetical protein